MTVRVVLRWWEGESQGSKLILEVEIINDLERIKIARAIEEALRSRPGSWAVVDSMDTD